MTVVRAGRRRIEITHPERILFPEAGLTKFDLAEYYRAAARRMVPLLRERPANLQRFPRGVSQAGFFQQELPDGLPDWVASTVVSKEGGGELRHVVVNEAGTLVALANLSAIVFHAWLSRVGRLDQPDRMIWDLDPSTDDPPAVRTAALQLKELLDELRLPAFIQTTGSRGYHVIVPLDEKSDYDTVRAFALDTARVLVARHPDALTIEARKASRGKRIYVDTLRNAYGHTAVASYSVRARPSAPVATPIGWDELTPSMRPDRFTTRTVLRRLGDDPWAGFRRRATGLAAARRRLDSILSPQ